GHHQQCAFSQQLPKQVRSICTNGYLQTELTLSRLVAGHEQQCNVDARDYQNQQHQAHENSNRLPILLVVAFDTFRRNELQYGLPQFWVDAAHANSGRLTERGLQRILCLLWRDAQTQPHHQEQAPPSRCAIQAVGCCRNAPRIELRTILQRNPKVGGTRRLNTMETGRGDTNDRERQIFYIERSL